MACLHVMGLKLPGLSERSLRHTFDIAEALQLAAHDILCHVASDFWRAPESRSSEIVAGRILCHVASDLWRAPQTRSREIDAGRTRCHDACDFWRAPQSRSRETVAGRILADMGPRALTVPCSARHGLGLFQGASRKGDRLADALQLVANDSLCH